MQLKSGVSDNLGYINPRVNGFHSHFRFLEMQDTKVGNDFPGSLPGNLFSLLKDLPFRVGKSNATYEIHLVHEDFGIVSRNVHVNGF